MAIAVASVSNTSLNNTTGSVIITKPTGLAAGDLMVAILSKKSTVVPNTLSGWTQIQTVDAGSFGDSSSNNGTLTSFYKVADSTDAAASNFTFTSSDSGVQFGGGILRITGHGGIIATSARAGSGNNGNPSYSMSVTPSFPNSLLIFAAYKNNSTVTSTTSGYAVTTDNPTWTEQFDDEGGGLIFTLSVATSIRSAVTATGNATLTYAAGGSNCDSIAQMIVITPVVDQTITPSTLSLIGSIQDSALQTGVTLTTNVLSLSTSLQESTTSIPVTWTNNSKNPSTWTNQNKS